MTDSTAVTRSTPWVRLAARAADPAASAIRARLAADPNRFARFSRTGAGLLLDLSRTALDAALLDDLLALADAAELRAFLRRMAAGAWVNATERRAALHIALRAPRSAGYRARTSDGWEDASGTIHAELDRMHAFVTAVHTGRIAAANGAPFATVLNLGIGGSDLGPAMVTEALAHTGALLDARFVGNVDGHALAPALARLDPARTLVLIASKSFTTQETMANASVAPACQHHPSAPAARRAGVEPRRERLGPAPLKQARQPHLRHLRRHPRRLRRRLERAHQPTRTDNRHRLPTLGTGQCVGPLV
jgi:glucose-6-phosphate isomerase